MQHPPQLRVAATYMRGGTSKGVFFRLQDLPEAVQQPGPQRDEFFLRVIGSPDPYEKHTDGMGGATSSTSKIVIVSASEYQDYDVDYLFGQVSIDKPFIDWSGNCGNLTAAVGAFAIENDLVDKQKIPETGTAEIRIWQANIHKAIIANIPVSRGMVQETGDFELDGVTFPAAEIKIEFMDPANSDQALFPTGHPKDTLCVPSIGEFEVTMITAGIPTVFLRASDIGYTGTELQEAINSDPEALATFETIRAHAALKMGLISDIGEAAARQHTPKIAFVAPPKSYTSSSKKQIEHKTIDLLVRALSMGKLHHAMMGTAAVAIGTAAAIEGTLVYEAAGNIPRETVTFGHPSGTLTVGAKASRSASGWQVDKAIMSRSARVLMEGYVRIPFVTE